MNDGSIFSYLIYFQFFFCVLALTLVPRLYLAAVAAAASVVAPMFCPTADHQSRKRCLRSARTRKTPVGPTAEQPISQSNSRRINQCYLIWIRYFYRFFFCLLHVRCFIIDRPECHWTFLNWTTGMKFETLSNSAEVAELSTKFFSQAVQDFINLKFNDSILPETTGVGNVRFYHPIQKFRLVFLI